MTGNDSSARVRAVRCRPFATVPLDIMTDAELKPADPTVLGYMLARAGIPGWELRVADVKRSLHLSEWVWRACRDRLQRAGYYLQRRTRLPAGAVTTKRGKPSRAGGRWEWEVVVTDTKHKFQIQAGDVDGTIPKKTMDGSTIHGEPADIKSKNCTKKKEQQQQQKRAAAAPEHKRKRVDGTTGLMYWYSDEPARIPSLVERFGLQAVREEVARRSKRGEDPLINQVEAALQVARRAELRADQSSKVSPRDTAADAAAARATLDSLKQLWDRSK